jgi:hypothetical protein
MSVWYVVNGTPAARSFPKIVGVVPGDRVPAAPERVRLGTAAHEVVGVVALPDRVDVGHVDLAVDGELPPVARATALEVVLVAAEPAQIVVERPVLHHHHDDGVDRAVRRLRVEQSTLREALPGQPTRCERAERAAPADSDPTCGAQEVAPRNVLLRIAPALLHAVYLRARRVENQDRARLVSATSCSIWSTRASTESNFTSPRNLLMKRTRTACP